MQSQTQRMFTVYWLVAGIGLIETLRFRGNPAGEHTIGLALFLAGWFFFFIGFKFLKEKWLMESIPTSPIRSAAMGQVELVGTAEAIHAIKTPFSGEPCVYYSYLVERYERQGKNSRWVKIDSGNTSHLAFTLRDETGATTILPTGAEFSLPILHRYSNSAMSSQPLPQGAHDFLRSRQIPEENWLGFEKKLRFTEWAITERASLFVMGTATPAANTQPIVAGSTALAESQESSGWIVTKGADDYFVISTKSRKEIASKIGWMAYCEVIGGALLAALGGWLWTNLF